MKRTLQLLAVTSLLLPVGFADAGTPVQILDWRYDPVVVFKSPSGSPEPARSKAELPTPISADDYDDRYLRFQDPKTGSVLFARKRDVKLAADSNTDRSRKYCGHATAAMGLGKAC